eukprot:TRINITY_DN67866_c2_g1_i2.p1 TRINITY_DN67866_c2_g1~~TRINITY_DN67866_c2_g1_i2.p1  ORF type:complete len:477 (-),score=66.32 TRINITY_DN67866_c2_g1_i2:64-1494(-)
MSDKDKNDTVVIDDEDDGKKDDKKKDKSKGDDSSSSCSTKDSDGRKSPLVNHPTLDECKEQLRGLLDMKSKRKPKPEQRISLDVGGRPFSVQRKHLCREKHSFLGSVFNGEVGMLPEETKKTFFIDRNPDLFALIVKYLQTGNTQNTLSNATKTPLLVQQVVLEAHFYRLKHLYAALCDMYVCPFKPVLEEFEERDGGFTPMVYKLKAVGLVANWQSGNISFPKGGTVVSKHTLRTKGVTGESVSRLEKEDVAVHMEILEVLRTDRLLWRLPAVLATLHALNIPVAPKAEHLEDGFSANLRAGGVGFLPLTDHQGLSVIPQPTSGYIGEGLGCGLSDALCYNEESVVSVNVYGSCRLGFVNANACCGQAGIELGNEWGQRSVACMLFVSEHYSCIEVYKEGHGDEGWCTQPRRELTAKPTVGPLGLMVECHFSYNTQTVWFTSNGRQLGGVQRLWFADIAVKFAVEQLNGNLTSRM